MAEVVLESVSKVYTGRVTAVRDLDLRVADGELLVLAGPSGCGKTTTCRLIAGLEAPTRGTILIGGRCVTGVRPEDRDVAMVFQDHALYPHMTAAGNLAFGLRTRGVPKPEIARRVAEIAALLGIEDLLDRRPRALSGGQRQRVAVGRALVRRARCFLLDEPLSNLDAAVRRQLRADLKALHRRLETTTIHVTHDQEEAMSLADRLLVMRGGRAEQAGPPLEVYRRPVNRFVAGFLGAPAMNFLDGGLQRDGGRVTFNDRHGIRIVLAARPAREPGAAVVLGVRPEHLRLADPSRPAAAQIEARVRVTETLGDRMDVHAETPGGATVVARAAPGATVRPGDTVTFELDPAAVHLFGPGNLGRRIDDNGPP